jgi:hypothetical protein
MLIVIRQEFADLSGQYVGHVSPYVPGCCQTSTDAEEEVKLFYCLLAYLTREMTTVYRYSTP